MQNLKIIAIIVITFAIAFTTTLLLEFAIFKHWLRITLVVLLIILELLTGFLIFKNQFNFKQKNL